jgi:hypothetical protein
MSGFAHTVGKIAGIASVVAIFVIPQLAPVLAAVSAAANAVGDALAKPNTPPAQGAGTQVTIGANQPTPYAMGRTYFAGAQILDVGYGATLDGVPNPYRSMAFVDSLGPIQGYVAHQVDFTTVTYSGTAATGYYAGFMYLASQGGACPESAALAGPWGAIPNWGAGYKLSGLAGRMLSLKFDKKGKVYASGAPQPGAILNGVYVYDMRQDSTQPGGSGSCRARNEATYVGGDAAKNPSCHAVTYALSRFQNGVKVFGPGFESDAIDWPAWTGFANVCDANGWQVNGTIYEGPGISRWDNLKRICAAGGGTPCFVGGLLSVRYQSPKVALDTITAADLADGEQQIAGMKTWKSRLNGIYAKYRSEAHQWEYVQATNLVTSSTYVTEDGEEKNQETQYDLVTSANQAVQLAAYDLADGRELGPFTLVLKPRLLAYRPGEALNVNIPEVGLSNQLCVVTGWKFDVSGPTVTLTLETETSAKHAFALGLTGTAPPSPGLTTGQDMDAVLSANATIANLTIDCPRVVDIAADSAGTITSLPKTITPTVFRGDADIRVADDVSYALQNASANVTTIAIDNTVGSADKGRVTVSALAGSGSYELVVTIGPTVFPPIKVTLQVNRAVPSSGGGGGGTTGGAFDGTGMLVSSTSFAEIGRVSGFAKTTGQTITASFSSDYEFRWTHDASNALVARWEISAAGAESWSTIGSAHTGTLSTFTADDLSSTVGAVTAVETSTPSNGSYDVRLVAALSATGGNISLDDGPGSVTVS